MVLRVHSSIHHAAQLIAITKPNKTSCTGQVPLLIFHFLCCLHAPNNASVYAAVQGAAGVDAASQLLAR